MIDWNRIANAAPPALRDAVAEEAKDDDFLRNYGVPWSEHGPGLFDWVVLYARRFRLTPLVMSALLLWTAKRLLARTTSLSPADRTEWMRLVIDAYIVDPPSPPPRPPAG
ncbi:MAG: hypothetical protein ACK53W_13460 [Gemmatimonadota bacterium]